MKKCVFPVIFSLLGVMIVACSYAKLQKKQMTICEGPYALCTSAQCIPNPSQPNESICFCEVLNGKSVGYSTCTQRKTYTDSKHLISTFSFHDFPKKRAMNCSDGNPWSNCLDQRCIVNPLDPSKAICSCKIVTTGTFQTLGGNCDTSTCATGYWSAATEESSQHLIQFFSNALGLEQSPERLCTE